MDIETVFPEVTWIEDADLRSGVVRAWEVAAEDAGISDLSTLPWLPPVQAELNLDKEYLVTHVRDVTALTAALAETLADRRAGSVSFDRAVAGALIHDVSKLYEFDGHERTEIGNLLGHPHFGVAVVEEAGLPTELAHITLSHTSRTTVEPATIEAEIVRRADEVAAAAIRLRSLDDLRDA